MNNFIELMDASLAMKNVQHVYAQGTATLPLIWASRRGYKTTTWPSYPTPGDWEVSNTVDLLICFTESALTPEYRTAVYVANLGKRVMLFVSPVARM